MSRTQQTLENLNAYKIRSIISKEHLALLSDLEIFETLSSTNTYLLDCAKSGSERVQVCLAEAQTAGRGRQTRTWYSPAKANIYCSLLWHFTLDPQALSALSLVIACSISNALRRFGLLAVQLKWPNDVLVHDRKLAGVLIETLIKAQGKISAVIGIGLNVQFPEEGIDTGPWIDLAEILPGSPIDRNRLSGLLIEALLENLPRFEKEGFKAFAKDWQAEDLLQGRLIQLDSPSGLQEGIVQGVNEKGELLVKTLDGIERHFASGEASIKK